MPAGVDATLYDFGRSVALWVSAFEILTRPQEGQASASSVYAVLDRVPYLDAKLG